MNYQDLIQGSPEWHAYRAEHHNASDAPAMLGCSPYKTRGDLLREVHTRLTPGVDAATQELFDRGHEAEALARPLAEAIIGESLYPVVGSAGKLSASFDGLTMDESTVFEHKSLNDALRARLPRSADSPIDGVVDLPKAYRVQMEQQLMVSGAGRALFMASKWKGDTLVEERHCWYYPDEEMRAEILNGWAQFEADLAAYILPVEVPAAPAGRAPETLPALRIEVTGQVTASNLSEFKATALATIRSVKRELSTDQDFADAEASVKWCGEVESRLEAAKQHALSQTATIDALFRAIDEISAEARRVRLDLEKVVKARKESIREEIVVAARRSLQDQARMLGYEVEPAVLSMAGLGDFACAIKGKRTIQTLRDACDVELARSKIALDEQARHLRANLAAYRKLAASREFLFPDLGTLAHKAADDFSAAVRQRIADHEAKEAKRREDETARIRAEEQAKAQREADERARMEAQAAEAKRLQDEAEMRARVIATASAASSPVSVPVSAPAPASTSMFASLPRAPSPSGGGAPEPATLNLGAICARLGFTVNAAFVTDTLGIAPAETVKAAKLYRESDFPRICAALVDHINQAATRDWRAAA